MVRIFSLLFISVMFSSSSIVLGEMDLSTYSNANESSFFPIDSAVEKKLKESGVIVLREGLDKKHLLPEEQKKLERLSFPQRPENTTLHPTKPRLVMESGGVLEPIPCEDRIALCIMVGDGPYQEPDGTISCCTREGQCSRICPF